MKEELEVPEDVEIELEDHLVRIKERDYQVERKLESPEIEIELKDNMIILSTKRKRKVDKSLLGTYRSHIRNMIEGVQEPFVYELKSVYSHFPTNIKVQDQEVVIENFMGEKNPRRIDIMENVEVEVDGETIEVKGPDKEKVGQTAARIEQECYKGNRDPRKFQDGVYITKKGDKSV